MAFVDIPTLNGEQIHISATAVYRVTRGIEGGGGPALTRVQFGADSQLTPLSASAVADLLLKGGAKLIKLTAPDDTEIFLSAPLITVIRVAEPDGDPPAAHAAVTVAGRLQFVKQTQAEVEQAIAAAG